MSNTATTTNSEINKLAGKVKLMVGKEVFGMNTITSM